MNSKYAKLLPASLILVFSPVAAACLGWYLSSIDVEVGKQVLGKAAPALFLLPIVCGYTGVGIIANAFATVKTLRILIKVIVGTAVAVGLFFATSSAVFYFAAASERT